MTNAMELDWIPAATDSIVAVPGRDGRRIVALVGPPGAGKTTCADALADALRARGLRCAVIPMDGFHLDDHVLVPLGMRPRKGAPETFDTGGLQNLLERLRLNKERAIAIPVFDRSLELSRNAARLVASDVEVLIVEGNYLLLDQPGWDGLAGLFDLTIALKVPREELRRRLVRRWQALGIPEAEITERVDDNDLRNGETVLQGSRPADMTISLSGKHTQTNYAKEGRS